MTSSEAYFHIRKLRTLTPSEAMRYLKTQPGLKPIFYYALNPYLTYGITSITISGPSGEMNFLEAGVKGLLDDLASRALSGYSAQSALYKTMKRLNEPSRRLLSMILDRKPRCGVAATTVNKVWPGLIPVHKVMLCQRFQPHRVKYPCFMEPKLDGLRATYVQGKLRSRIGLPFIGLEHIEECLRPLGDWEWDGELMIPGLTFQALSGLLRNHQKVPQAVFHVFAVRNRKVAPNFWPELEFGVGCVKKVPRTLIHTEEALYQYYHEMRDLGFEGAVIKTVNYQYEGKRSWNWMKMKPFRSGEFKIIGFYEGKGEYTGMLGGVTIDFNGLPNDVGTGFTDNERMLIWHNKSQYLNQYATIEYMEKTDDENMRHSRWKGLRWDK